MSSKARLFADFTERLRNALANGDWEGIAALDDDCSALIATLQDEDAAGAELREAIEAMAEVYAKLQAAGKTLGGWLKLFPKVVAKENRCVL